MVSAGQVDLLAVVSTDAKQVRRQSRYLFDIIQFHRHNGTFEVGFRLVLKEDNTIREKWQEIIVAEIYVYAMWNLVG